VILLETVAAMRQQAHHWRQQGQRIALVPTMGNLHAGHLRLVEQAKQQAERVVVSIFVNPMQFGPNEDFDRYPRTLAADTEKLAARGVDAIFAPSVEEMYPREQTDMAMVSVPGLSDMLCGAHRPGHFAGVATVLVKLFNMVQPQLAFFGKKDYQQWRVIERFVADLNLPIEIVGCETEREADGLAMSSRNQYLSPEQRQTAVLVWQTLQATAAQICAGSTNYSQLEKHAVQVLSDEGFVVDYYQVCGANSLKSPIAAMQKLVVLAAVRLGTTRLIDNITLNRPL